MPAMLISKEDWKTIQSASESGVGDHQLSEDYGVSRASIRKRRQLDKWMTPRKIAEEIAVAKAKAVFRQSPGNVSQLSRKPSAEESVAATITRLTDRNQLRAAQKIDNALRSMSELEIETVAELATGIKLLRLMDGRDREGNTLALNLGAFWSAPQNGTESPPAKAVVVDV